MKSALLLGNAPIVGTTNFDVVPRDLITICGVNRLWHKEDPERQFVQPQIYCVLDHTVEQEWIPEVGDCETLLTAPTPKRRKHRPETRPDAVCRHWRTYSDRLAWPEPGGPFFNVKSSPGFALQYLIEEGYDQIALLGIEYSTKQLHTDGKQTHAHGDHGRFARIAATLDSYRGHPRQFWTRALHVCVDRGIKAWNLTPHKTPFHEIGFPHKTMAQWIDSIRAATPRMRIA